MSTESTYDQGFSDGLAAAAALTRAGATGDDLALLLADDPGRQDPRGYSDLLNSLRAILDTNGLFTGATA